MPSLSRAAALLLALPALLAGRPAVAAPAVVELQTASGTWQGRSIAHDARRCWLLERTGQLHDIPLSDVTDYRLTGQNFRPESVVEARDRLRREAGPGLEVAAKGKYVVCAPVGQAATYAALLDSVYNSFWLHFSRRNVGLQPPEFPLIAVVFPTRQQFIEHARKDFAFVPAGLAGYYNRRSNRIALYSDAPLTAAGAESPVWLAPRLSAGWAAHISAIDAAIEAGARETLIHEATHQLAYNTGLHSRLAETPRWAVEGLAMLFEEDARRDDTGGRNSADRINRPRYIWFMSYRKERRKEKSLATLLEGDDLFRSAPLDFYSEAWALSFYLAETRPAEYSRYLRLLASRDPFAEDSPATRVAEFQSVFGRDLDRLEGQFLLWVDRLYLR